MTDGELEHLLKDLESDRVERKESFSDPEKIREAVCAFANDLPGHDRPGVIFIGAKDDGGCAGLQVTDDLLRRLAGMRDDGLIQPLPSLVVQHRDLAGCRLGVVLVQPAQAPPVRYRGRVLVRVGPTTRVAMPSEERQLGERRRFRDLPWDLHPMTSASMADLDLYYFEREYLPLAFAPDILAANERSVEDQLKSLRFLSPDGFPTVVGLLVLGKKPQDLLPGAYIQFLRLEGSEVTDPVRDAKRADGRLADVVRRIEEILDVHNTVAVSFTDTPTETRQWTYPPAALQQLVRNAVLHRVYEGTNAPVRVHWFDDRVEIVSPGGPFGEVNERNFGQPHLSDYRNPHVAEAMRVLGFVQRFGVGIDIARRELQKNGNPDLEFDVTGTYVRAIVKKGRQAARQVA